MSAINFQRASERTYEAAIKILNSRRRAQRPTTALKAWQEIDQNAEAKNSSQLKGVPSIAGMQEWLLQLGHKLADINRLNVIHVAGTKGKGSTCAFTESFLRAYGTRTGFPSKTGLYTSPHLIIPEERIRIGSKPISRDLFTKYFFEVWDSLSQNATGQLQPRYLQLLALTAFHAFVQEKVEATIIETHHGGEYDATNFIECPVVTLVTALGMDHVQQLGPTLEDIAWHKAGIFKSKAPAFSAIQDQGAADVLRQRAMDKSTSLVFVDPRSSSPAAVLQLKPSVQQANCALALAGANAFIKAKQRDVDFPLLPQDINQGIKQFEWPGRFQTVVEGNSHWYLDGAHNEMSIVKAAEWYTQLIQTQQTFKTVLIFGHISEQREALDVLKTFAQALSKTSIDHVIFTYYEVHNLLESEENFKGSTPSEADLMSLNDFQREWKAVKPSEHITITHNVEDAMTMARMIGRESSGVRTLITGSQHLVGKALSDLNQRHESKGNR